LFEIGRLSPTITNWPRPFSLSGRSSSAGDKAKEPAVDDCRSVERVLRATGVLVRQDKLLPSVVGIITGERLTTSWWNHPKAHEIFHCLEQLAEDSDVLVSRLIGGKVTYIDRRLWPAFLAVATSH
jgi:hypothetical protein